LNKNEFIQKNLDQLFQIWLTKIAFIGSILFLLVSVLDYVSAREHYFQFLTYRIIIASVLLTSSFLTKKTANKYLHHLYAYVVIAASAAVIEAMVLQLNGHTSTYYVGLILLGICILGFIPASIYFHVSVALLIYSVYLFPILIYDKIEDFRTFFTSNFFILVIFLTALVLRFFSHRGLINELGLQYDLKKEQDQTAQVVESLKIEIAERKRTVEDLKISEQKYRSLVDSTEDSIYLVDRNYRYLFVNKDHLARISLSEDQYIGRSYSEFHSPDETEWFINAAGKVFETDQSVRHEHKSMRDGRYFLLSLSPVKNEDGKTIAVTVVSKNISELKKMQEELRELSLTDELTGLYNRRGCFTLAEHVLKMADRSKKGIYMLYADLDNLKTINDTYGHAEGDSAVIEAADLLKNNYRESDIIARIGGDEFVVIPVGSAEDTVEIIKARLQKALDIHNEKSNRNYRLSMSVGIAYYDPAQPCSMNDLISRADKLMYNQKKDRQNSSGNK